MEYSKHSYKRKLYGKRSYSAKPYKQRSYKKRYRKKEGKQYAVQVKRYAAHRFISEPTVRDFYGSFVGDDFSEGFFITTSDFTKAAREWAASKPIHLVDGKVLTEMLHKHTERV